MRKALLLFTIIFIGTAVPAFAQQSPPEAPAPAKARKSGPGPAPQTPSREQVVKLLDLLQVKQNMAVMMDGIKQAMKEGAERGFRERIPEPTQEQLAALNQMVDDMMAEMPLDDMLEALVPIYQKHLSRSDVEEMIRFYSSPVGQKVLHEQGPMLRESMEAGAHIQQKKMDQIMEKIRERTEKMIEEGKPAEKAPKP